MITHNDVVFVNCLVHPSCLSLKSVAIDLAQNIAWQCPACKTCEKCCSPNEVRGSLEMDQNVSFFFATNIFVCLDLILICFSYGR